MDSRKDIPTESESSDEEKNKTIVRQNELIDQLNQHLTQTQNRIRNILVTLPLGLLLVSDGRDILASNSRIEQIFGYDKNELSGNQISVLFPEIDSLEISNNALRVTAKRKGGEIITCEIFVNEIEEDGARRVFVHVQDISERQRLEQLRHDFVNMVTHDLRTPLTSITMSLDMIQRGTCGPITDTAETVIEQAQSSSKFLISLVTELLDSEKIQSSEFSLDVGRTTVRAILDKSIAATTGMANQAKVVIETDFTNDVFRADEDRVAQVLINLIGNALKYSPPQSKVIVKAGIAGLGVTFSVIDQGPGIPKPLQAAVFERYRQLGQPTKIKKRGFGLGLAICKTIVEAHHGSIWVKSEEGKGSTFEFVIPLVDEPL